MKKQNLYSSNYIEEIEDLISNPDEKLILNICVNCLRVKP